MPNDHDDFPELEDTKGPGGSGNKAVIVIGLILLIGAAVTVFTVKGNLFSNLHFTGSKQTDETTAANVEYVDFAERFAAAVFNISYQNFDQQVQKTAELMDDDLLEAYKANFMSASFRQKLLDQKAYINFQKIDRAAIDSISGTQIVVRVDGVNYYNSDVNSAQIQLPFSFNVVIQKVQGKLRVINFKQRL